MHIAAISAIFTVCCSLLRNIIWQLPTAKQFYTSRLGVPVRPRRQEVRNKAANTFGIASSPYCYSMCESRYPLLRVLYRMRLVELADLNCSVKTSPSVTWRHRWQNLFSKRGAEIHV